MPIESESLVFDNLDNTIGYGIFEIFYINSVECILSTVIDNIYYYIDLYEPTTTVTFLSGNSLENLTDFQKQKLKFNLLEYNNGFLIVKNVLDKQYVLTNLNNTIDVEELDIENINETNLLSIVKMDNLSIDFNNKWISYKKINNNRLDISQENSISDITNNSLNHFEYNSIKSEILFNEILLKNQLNNDGEIERKYKPLFSDNTILDLELFPTPTPTPTPTETPTPTPTPTETPTPTPTPTEPPTPTPTETLTLVVEATPTPTPTLTPTPLGIVTFNNIQIEEFDGDDMYPFS